MNVIDRKITLDSFRSHYHSFIPYIGIEYDGMGKPIFPEHGNWGQFPYDIDLCKCEGASDLKKYFVFEEEKENVENFTELRVTFLQLVEKYRLLNGIIRETHYQRRVRKGGKDIIYDYNPTLGEKYNIEILPLVYDDNGEVQPIITNNDVWGVYTDNSFNDNGGLEMLNFVSTALGFFVVDPRYVGDNYVPEIMCYAEIETYRQRMSKLRNSQDCCVQDEYVKYGGDEFYVYLGGKLQALTAEIDYWQKSLYINNNEFASPEIFLPVSLNANFHNIGIYSVLNDGENGNINHDKIKCENVENSKLMYLRHSKVSYCEKIVDGVSKEEELPFILIEDETNGVLIAKTPYMVGYAKNIQMEFDGFYGDLITEISTGTTADTITYVIGAEIKYNYSSQKWEVVDNTTGVKYVEEIPYSIYDYTTNEELYYPMLQDGEEVNAFKDNTLIIGIDNVKVYEIDGTAEVKTEFWVYNDEEMLDNRIIMDEYNFGKIDALVENVAEVSIDRGYVSAFELLYKMGEINTMDDIVNYSNNIFGL